MTIQFYPPQFNGNISSWVSGLITTLQEVFFEMEEHMHSGTIVLWPTGVDIPIEYLLCNGAEYKRAVSPALYKLMGASSAGKFRVPTVAGPTGSVAVIRV